MRPRTFSLLVLLIGMVSTVNPAIAGPQSFSDILQNAARSTLQHAINSATPGTHRMDPEHSGDNPEAPAATGAEVPELTKILWVYAPSAGYRFIGTACANARPDSFVYLQAQSNYEQGDYFGAGTQYQQYAEAVAECAVMPLGISPPSARTLTPAQAYTIVGHALARSFLADVKVTAGPLSAEDKIKATNAVKLLDVDQAANADLIRQVAATGVFGRPPVLPKPVLGASDSNSAQ